MVFIKEDILSNFMFVKKPLLETIYLFNFANNRNISNISNDLEIKASIYHMQIMNFDWY